MKNAIVCDNSGARVSHNRGLFSHDPNLVASNTLNAPLTTNPLAMDNPLSKKVAVLTVTASPKIAAHIFIADNELTDSNIAGSCYQPIPVSRIAVSLQLNKLRRPIRIPLTINISKMEFRWLIRELQAIKTWMIN